MKRNPYRLLAALVLLIAGGVLFFTSSPLTFDYTKNSAGESAYLFFDLDGLLGLIAAGIAVKLVQVELRRRQGLPRLPDVA